MIYDAPGPEIPIDQGDLIDDCPVFSIVQYDLLPPSALVAKSAMQRVIVVTQTCDLANEKAKVANVAEVHSAQVLVEQNVLRPSDIKGPIRGGRVWGLYFLPAHSALGLSEMIVDLRRLHTVRLDLLRDLIRAGQRRGRMQALYREHLAKHFADTFSRIGLPRPYETL
jgi:hypothetical protein